MLIESPRVVRGLLETLFIVIISIFVIVYLLPVNENVKLLKEKQEKITVLEKENADLKDKLTNKNPPTETKKETTVEPEIKAEELPGWQKIKVQLNFLTEDSPYFKDIYYQKGPKFNKKENFYDLFIKSPKGSLTFDGSLISHVWGRYASSHGICIEVLDMNGKNLIGVDIQGNRHNLFRAVESICTKEGLIKEPFDWNK